MKPEAKITVGLKSKQQAELYSQCGNFGRAFAHYLVVLKLLPEFKEELKTTFSSTLCTWGEKLESQSRYADLFQCYEQAIEVFPENEQVLCNLGAHLFSSR
uniref:Tetratricopeptide repeat protein n=1 Tax=Clastoptera arizonana TaxID=38151 RepID=A0A1B6CI22_9HEMI